MQSSHRPHYASCPSVRLCPARAPNLKKTQKNFVNASYSKSYRRANFRLKEIKSQGCHTSKILWKSLPSHWSRIILSSIRKKTNMRHTVVIVLLTAREGEETTIRYCLLNVFLPNYAVDHRRSYSRICYHITANSYGGCHPQHRRATMYNYRNIQQ